MRYRKERANLYVVLVLGITMGAAVATAQEEVGAGYDLFATDPLTTDLLGIPFEGDAGVRPTFDFVPPPDSADGRRAVGNTDTIVHRLESASVPAVPGTADPITIELVLLRLVSTIDFELELGGDEPTTGPLFVTLQKDRKAAGEVRLNFDVPPPPPPDPGDPDPPPPPPAAGPVEEDVLPGPRSFGEMTITFASSEGGTFDSRLEIFADLRIGGPEGPIVCGESASLPPCSDLDAGLVLESVDSAWGREAVPESIRIRGVNFSLTAPDREDPVDSSVDFWAGVDPTTATTVCVEHGGHPDPGGAPTAHGTCRTPCTPGGIAPDSCRNGRDDDCNGTIDDCDEDLFGPSVTAPPDRTFECPRTTAEVAPPVTGFATATDNCFPPTLPADSITFSDFRTDECGRTFLVDRIWTATDACGNAASSPDLQQIRVVDTTDPTIDCPEDRTILWTDDRGTDSLGSATGADTCGGVTVGFVDRSIAGECRSEEVTRTWTATDDCGLETPCPQQISVRGPKDAIEDLEALLAGLGLRRGIENALATKLKNAVSRVCAGDSTPAVNQLEAFVNQVQAQAGRSIDPADAAALIAAAEAIIAAIEDPANGGACPEGCGEEPDGGGGPPGRRGGAGRT